MKNDIKKNSTIISQNVSFLEIHTRFCIFTHVYFIFVQQSQSEILGIQGWKSIGLMTLIQQSVIYDAVFFFPSLMTDTSNHNVPKTFLSNFILHQEPNGFIILSVMCYVVSNSCAIVGTIFYSFELQQNSFLCWKLNCCNRCSFLE